MSNNINYNLELNKNIMNVLLKRYSDTYVMANLYDNEEYKSIHDNVKNNISKEFTKMENIYNQLLNKTSTQSKNIQNKDKRIKNLKNDYSSIKSIENNVLNSSFASKPRLDDTNTFFSDTKVRTILYIISILGLGFLMYKSYKKIKDTIPETSIKNLLPKVGEGNGV